MIAKLIVIDGNHGVLESFLRGRFENCINSDVVGFSEYLKKNDVMKYVVVTDDVTRWSDVVISNSIVQILGKDTEKIMREIEWILSDFGKGDKMNGNIFFTSDTHFNHGNIIKYCNRPWNRGKNENGELIVDSECIADMNEEIIRRWNSVVGKDDTVWHLGDFCLGPKQNETIPNIVKRLNGKINLVLGNHDHHSVKFYYDAGFNRVYDRSVVINNFVILSHAPMEFVKSPFFNIAGHVHDCETYKTWSKNSCIVCVERHDYTPISWNEIERKYKEMN